MRIHSRTCAQAALAGALVTGGLFALLGSTDAQPAKGARPAVDRYGDPLPPGAIARFGTVRFRHGSHVTSLAVSPDGQLVASAGDWCVCLWERATGKFVRELPHANEPSHCEFSADGRVLLVAGLARVHVWDVASGKRLATFAEKKREGMAAALSPDGGTVALAYVGEHNGRPTERIRLRDVATGKELRSFGDHPVGIDQLVFAPDGKTVLSASCRGSAATVFNASHVR